MTLPYTLTDSDGDQLTVDSGNDGVFALLAKGIDGTAVSVAVPDDCALALSAAVLESASQPSLIVLDRPDTRDATSIGILLGRIQVDGTRIRHETCCHHCGKTSTRVMGHASATLAASVIAVVADKARAAHFADAVKLATAFPDATDEQIEAFLAAHVVQECAS